MNIPAQKIVTYPNVAPNTDKFSFKWWIYTKSDLIVTKDGNQLTLNTDFTLPDTAVMTRNGGDITLKTPAVGGETIVIKRETAIHTVWSFTVDGEVRAETLDMGDEYYIALFEDMFYRIGSSIEENRFLQLQKGITTPSVPLVIEDLKGNTGKFLVVKNDNTISFVPSPGGSTPGNEFLRINPLDGTPTSPFQLPVMNGNNGKVLSVVSPGVLGWVDLPTPGGGSSDYPKWIIDNNSRTLGYGDHKVFYIQTFDDDTKLKLPDVFLPTDDGYEVEVILNAGGVFNLAIEPSGTSSIDFTEYGFLLSPGERVTFIYQFDATTWNSTKEIQDIASKKTTDEFNTLRSQLGTSAFRSVGTSQGNVVEVLPGGKLPTLDGSNLTGITSGSSFRTSYSEKGGVKKVCDHCRWSYITGSVFIMNDGSLLTTTREPNFKISSLYRDVNNIKHPPLNTNVNEEFVDVFRNTDQMFAITQTRIFVAGSNEEFQLGLPTDRFVLGLTDSPLPAGLLNSGETLVRIVAPVCGQAATDAGDTGRRNVGAVILTSEGNLISSGVADDGFFGISNPQGTYRQWTKMCPTLPGKVVDLEWGVTDAVGSNAYRGCIAIVDNNGTKEVYTWGANRYNALAGTNNSTELVPVLATGIIGTPKHVYFESILTARGNWDREDVTTKKPVASVQIIDVATFVLTEQNDLYCKGQIGAWGITNFGNPEYMVWEQNVSKFKVHSLGDAYSTNAPPYTAYYGCNFIYSIINTSNNVFFGGIWSLPVGSQGSGQPLKNPPPPRYRSYILGVSLSFDSDPIDINYPIGLACRFQKVSPGIGDHAQFAGKVKDVMVTSTGSVITTYDNKMFTTNRLGQIQKRSDNNTGWQVGWKEVMLPTGVVVESVHVSTNSNTFPSQPLFTIGAEQTYQTGIIFSLIYLGDNGAYIESKTPYQGLRAGSIFLKTTLNDLYSLIISMDVRGVFGYYGKIIVKS